MRCRGMQRSMESWSKLRRPSCAAQGKRKCHMGLLVFGLVLVVLVIYVITINNTLVTLKNRYLNAFSQIEVQLKRRYDLIPNLVETAKSYMAHERGTLEAVTNARNDAAA